MKRNNSPIERLSKTDVDRADRRDMIKLQRLLVVDGLRSVTSAALNKETVCCGLTN